MTGQETAAAAKPRIDLHGAMRPALPAIALVCALIAAWMAWSGYRAWAAERRESALVTARDAAAKQVADTVAKDLAQLRTRVAVAFGSCSFTEPVDDLRALGFLP